MMAEETVVEERAGHCWCCRKPFQPGELITLVPRRFLFRTDDGEIRRYPDTQWGTMCPRCTTEQELAEAPRRVSCEGCGQPLAAPPGSRRVCSVRCAQRWRRRSRAHQLTVCVRCGEPFRPTRDDARFCSGKCRQSAYRRRLATGEKVEPRSQYDPNDAIHLDEIGGVLHYQGTPIIALSQLRRWPGYNRHVGALPIEVIPQVMPSAVGYNLFECLECRRWSVSRAVSFCSRKCRLAHHAQKARERRV